VLPFHSLSLACQLNAKHGRRNEPDCGWSWVNTAEAVSAYLLYWDATAAGVADAEAALGTAFRFGGPATCKAQGGDYWPALMAHTRAFVGDSPRTFVA
jgi:hypothetical protein